MGAPRSIVSEEAAELELERIAQASGHATFRAIVGWLRGNRDTIDGRLDDQDKVLERIESKVDKTNGSVAVAFERIGVLEVQATVNRELINARREWEGVQEMETGREALREERRRDRWAMLACALLGAVGTALVVALTHL